MAWSDEHRAFVVEEFIQNGGSPVMTQRDFLSSVDMIPFTNFTNGHSTTPRLLCGVPFFSLMCEIRTFLKRAMLL
jgi:hypothetical protein